MRKRIFIIVAVIVMISLIYILTFAKFKSNSLLDYFISSKNFYFESDSLSTDEKEIVNNMWDKSAISFKVKNFDNQDIATEDEIRYSVECNTNDSNINCYINNTTSNKVNLSIAGNEKREETISITVDSQNEINDVEVSVIVKTTTPYEKTLRGKYILHKVDTIESNIEYEIVNNEVYSNMLLTNNTNENKCLSISINNNDIKVYETVDMFDISSDNDYINNFKLNLDGNTTYDVKLFNSNSSIISKENITVSECQ